MLKAICENKQPNMKFIIIFLIFVLFVLAMVFAYLYLENQKPIKEVCQPTEFNVDGLVPYSQWQTQYMDEVDDYDDK